MQRSNIPVPSQNLNLSSTSNKDGTILPSAARIAATYNSNAYSNPSYRGVRIFIDITNANGGNLIAKIQNFDPVSGNWVDLPLAVTAALAANATTSLTVYPGITETANVDVANPLGAQWRVNIVVAAATMTFSVGGEYLA